MKELKRLFTRKMIHRRVFSSLLAMLLVITSVIHPINMVPVYATSNWLRVNYQEQAKEDVEIYVQAEDASFEPGETIVLDVFVQNNSSEFLKGSGLSIKGDTKAFTETEFILTEACGDASISDKGTVINLDLAPGETKALQFEGTLEDGLEALDRKEIRFFYGAHNESEEVVTATTEYQFTVGLFNELSIDFTDGKELIPEETNTIEITMGLNDLGYYYETEVATDSNAEVATDSDTNVETDSDAELATDSNAEADNTYVFDITGVTLNLETAGVKFEHVKLEESSVSEENGTITALVSYEVAADAEPGEYFGTLTASVANGSKTYKSETAFQFEVVDAAIANRIKKSGLFTAELENFTVHVDVAAGAFDEKVELVVTELAEDSEEFKTAEAAMENHDREYDGMMALDICFINGAGKEVEPNEGYSVQVSIEMKAEVLPEGIDTESLMVHHIAETTTDDVQAEVVVEDVADTADATAGIVEVKEVDEAPVVAAEFSVVSFSMFTITWSTRTLTVIYAKADLTELSASGFNTTEVAANSSFDLSNYTKSPIVATTDGKAYAISKIVLKESSAQNAKTLVEYNYNDLNSNNTIKWQSSLKYYENSSSGTQVPDKAVLYLVYEQDVPLTTFQGLDTQDVITVHVTNYNQGDKQGNFIINNTGEDSSWNGVNINHWTGKDSENKSLGVRQGIVERVLLEEGYPAVASNEQDKKSLAKFFTEGWDGNYLFQKDSEGYYYYDSYKNFAHLDKDKGEFVLYKVPHATGKAIDYGSEPQFMPFNTITSSLKKTGDDGLYYEFGEDKNYYFGMMVEFEFTMPKDGMIDGKPMIFEFAGDDDVWVFIDNVLVLDMGGVHLSCNGNINFATGNVDIDRVYSYNNGSKSTSNVTETLNELYEKAGKKSDYSDYSKHTLKFFYMERGAGGSNCTLRFNIQPIPPGTINFEKKVGYSNTADAADIDFKFKVFVDWDGEKGADGEYNYEPYNGKYNVYNASDRTLKRKNVDTSSDGTILLKDGEMASLATNITAKSRFYIQEIGATSDKYDVYVNSSYIQENIPGSTSNSYNGVQSNEYIAGETPYIIFKNDVVIENQYNLNIHKQLSDQSESDEYFEFSLLLGKDTQTIYTGDYTVMNGDDEIVSENNKATDGVIRIKAGQYAKITGLIGGNTIEVKEDISKLSAGTYLTPTYKIEGAVDTSETIIDSTTNKDTSFASCTVLEGKLLDKGVVNVYVTNNKKVTSLTVSKEVTGNMADLSKEFTFTVSSANGVETFELHDGESKTINNLPVGTDVTITEDTDGYTLDQVKQGTKVFGNTEIAVNSQDSDIASVTVTLEATNEVVIFTNKKDAIIDTGISMDTLPYILIMLAVIGGIVFTVIRKRKDDDLD